MDILSGQHSTLSTEQHSICSAAHNARRFVQLVAPNVERLEAHVRLKRVGQRAQPGAANTTRRQVQAAIIQMPDIIIPNVIIQVAPMEKEERSVCVRERE